MGDLAAEPKAPRLCGMAEVRVEPVGPAHGAGVEASCWSLEQRVQAEATDRAMRSVSYQITSAKFPSHRDLSGFDRDASLVYRKGDMKPSGLAFTMQTHNMVLIGGPGTGKTYSATTAMVMSMSGITRPGRRVRFCATAERVNALSAEKAQGTVGRIASSLLRLDAVILDELGYLPFSQAGGALPFHLLSKRYAHKSVIITTNRDVAKWRRVFINAKMTTALPDRLAHHCHIAETGNESYRFSHGDTAAERRGKPREAAPRHVDADAAM